MKAGTAMAFGSRVGARRLALVSVIVALLAVMVPVAPPARGATLPAGFQESTVFSGLVNPTVVRFAPTGGCSSPRRAASSRSSTR